MARCSKCGKQFADTLKACPYCKTPVMADESNDTIHVMNALREIYNTFGIETIRDKQRFISILRDYIPEYDKERRLLTTAIENGIVDALSKENVDKQSAIIKAREFMEREMFLSKVAVEFIIETITYMFGWDYESDEDFDDVPTTSNQNKVSNSNVEIDETTTPIEEDKKQSSTETKFFTNSDAVKISKFKLSSSIEIPAGYTAIKGFAFDDFTNLKSVIIPEGVVAIGEYAFSNCSKLVNVKLPNSLRFIKNSAFEFCSKLNKLELPVGVISIEDNTFQFCDNLETIVIPNTVGSIGAYAFTGCENLGTIFIPDSVKYIGEGVFEYCPNVIIECVEYSYVHKYCKANGIMHNCTK